MFPIVPAANEVVSILVDSLDFKGSQTISSEFHELVFGISSDTFEEIFSTTFMSFWATWRDANAVMADFKKGLSSISSVPFYVFFSRQCAERTSQELPNTKYQYTPAIQKEPRSEQLQLARRSAAHFQGRCRSRKSPKRSPRQGTSEKRSDESRGRKSSDADGEDLSIHGRESEEVFCLHAAGQKQKTHFSGFEIIHF